MYISYINLNKVKSIEVISIDKGYKSITQLREADMNKFINLCVQAT